MQRLRYLVGLLVLAAALSAVPAGAGTFRPSLAVGAFTPLAGASTPCMNGGIPCYLPAEIRAAYDYPSGPGAPTGAGQTIVVVTAYGAPFVREDLLSFAAVNGYPFEPDLVVETQQTPVDGTAGSDQTYFWQVETDLDVQWAYAMAPEAKIVLAVANSDDTRDVAQVMREVLPRHPGAIVTQSFGIDEAGSATDPTLVDTFQPLYLDVVRRGGTVLAAAGDLGASNGTELEGVPPSAMAAYPASDPLVLAVGGTMGNPFLLGDDGYGAEQAWNELSPFGGLPGAGGGAPSVVFDAPPWQRSLHTKARLEPDVSYNASLVDGALVVLSCHPASDGTLGPCDPEQQGIVSVGGTSAGAPQWAAIVALANQVRMSQAKPPLGLVAPVLYELARNPRSYARDFHDVTAGSNTLAGSAFGFDATPGYDLATGLGTPDVANLVADLAQQGSGAVPGNLTHRGRSGKGGRPRHFDPSK